MSRRETNLAFDRVVLDNGLTLIGERNPAAHTFAAAYFVATGARDETSDIAGVSHFLEHMMFKGTARRSAHHINREFDELGAVYNAFTSDERTVYHASVLSGRRPEVIDLLTDMMRPALRNEDFEVEKQVILEEIAMYEDRPQYKVFEEGLRRYYNGHPLGHSVLGSQDSIMALTREDMESYFAARYASDNLLLAVTGQYDWNALVTQVAELTRDWQPSGASRSYPLLDTRHGAEHLSSVKVNRAHVALFAPGVSVQDPRRYAASVLANCLGDTSGSRLYWALVDPGVAEAASVAHDSADRAGAFLGYLSTNRQDLEAATSILNEALAKFQDDGVDEDEWRRAQRKVATGVTLRGETPAGRLMPFGGLYQATKTYESLSEAAATILSLTVDDAADLLALRPFDLRFTLVLEPAAD